MCGFKNKIKTKLKVVCFLSGLHLTDLLFFLPEIYNIKGLWLCLLFAYTTSHRRRQAQPKRNTTTPSPTSPPLHSGVSLFIIHCVIHCYQAHIIKYLVAPVYAFRHKMKVTAAVIVCLAFKD